MIEGSMIEWTKRADGTWKFDYNIFDQYVQLAMEAGVNKAITIYTPVPWGHRFPLPRRQIRQLCVRGMVARIRRVQVRWTVFLDDLKRHLEQKGWSTRPILDQ